MLFPLYVILESATLFLGIWILYQECPDVKARGKIGTAICIGLGIFIYYAHIVSMWDSYISNISILIDGILLGLLFSWYFQVNYLPAIVLESFFWVNVSLFKLPILIIEGVVKHDGLVNVNRGDYTLIEFVWSIIVLLLIYGIYCKTRKNRGKIYHTIGKYWKRILTVSIIQWCMMSYNMWLGRHSFEVPDLVVNISLILVTQILLQYLILKSIQQEVVAENQLLDMAQKILQNRNNELQIVYEEGREQIHEVYHNMTYLYHCLKDNKIAEAEEFLKSKLKDYQNCNKSVWTGLPFLDFLINYKKGEMDKKNIDFSLYLDVYEYPFEDVDLGILLGNLLDNAIEASEKCEQGKRRIYLQLRNLKQMFVLRLKNSSMQAPKIENGIFLTSKEDKNAHGMGVEQVKRIVNKYNGEIDFQYDSARFEVDIIVPLIREGENYERRKKMGKHNG